MSGDDILGSHFSSERTLSRIAASVRTGAEVMVAMCFTFFQNRDCLPACRRKRFVHALCQSRGCLGGSILALQLEFGSSTDGGHRRCNGRRRGGGENGLIQGKDGKRETSANATDGVRLSGRPS